MFYKVKPSLTWSQLTGAGICQPVGGGVSYYHCDSLTVTTPNDAISGYTTAH